MARARGSRCTRATRSSSRITRCRCCCPSRPRRRAKPAAGERAAAERPLMQVLATRPAPRPTTRGAAVQRIDLPRRRSARRPDARSRRRATEPPPEETFIPPKAKSRRRSGAQPARRRPAAPPSHALRAFFEGAGLPHKELSPMEADRMLRDCGAILRAAVEGIMMLLLARAEMRKEFEAEERTMVAARDNNPLKLMSDPHEAMDFLFDPARAHRRLPRPGAGGRRRLRRPALARARPDGRHARRHPRRAAALRSAASSSARSRRAPRASASRAARRSCGRCSSLQQDKLSRDAQEDFNKVFGRDFMGAYQAQLRRLKGGR